MNLPEPSSALNHAANVLQNRPDMKLLALALHVAQEIPNELPAQTSPRESLDESPRESLDESSLSKSHAMFRAKALAAVGAAVLETSRDDRALSSHGRLLVKETINFVSRHVKTIASSEMSELLVPIAVAAQRVRYDDLVGQCVALGELLVERVKDPDREITVGMYPFWRLAYGLVEQGKLENADRVLQNLMTPKARGKAVTCMIQEVQKVRAGEQDKKLLAYIMNLGRQSYDELVELSQEHQRFISATGELAYALASLYASHRMVHDMTEVVDRVPEGVDLGKIYGVAVATSLNVSRYRPGRVDGVKQWREWFDEFRERVRMQGRDDRYYLRTSFALEVAVRAGDVREVLWSGDKAENREPERRKGGKGRVSERFDRYLAKLICYSNVGNEVFEELLARLPNHLKRIADDNRSDISAGEAVSNTLRSAARGVTSLNKQEAIFKKVVEACRNLSELSGAEDKTALLEWADYSDHHLVDGVEVLLRKGYPELAYELFTFVPEKSDLGFYAVTAFANNAALHHDPRQPESLQAAEALYEEACKKVLVVAPDPSVKKTKGKKSEELAANREAVGALWMIGESAAAHCCDIAALAAFLRAHERIKAISAKSSARFRFSLVENITKGFVAGWKRRTETGAYLSQDEA